MRVLLLSMPDSFEHMPSLAIRMPNGALTSLAGNLDAHHRVAVADLILVQSRVRETVERLVREFKPDLVGLSVMTFQRPTALRLIALLRALCPQTRIAVGGYDPSLAPEAYTGVRDAPDFLVRGEGEITFRDLVRAIEGNSDYAHIPGLSYRSDCGFLHNPERPVTSLEGSQIRRPNRDARVLTGYTMVGRQVDVMETSRGCTFDCSFCSIVEMRGRNFHTYTFDRVLADIYDARAHGAQTIFLVDDNITLNIRRFEALCLAIIAARLNSLEYVVQAMKSAIANHGATLAPVMRQAGFRYVFLGIENILERDLEFLRARAKNTGREDRFGAASATIQAINYLHQHKMYVVGGLIVGNPDDTRESIEANLEFARRYVDYPYIQHPTPYPRTSMAKDFRERELIISEDVGEYDGTTAVVRSEHLTGEEIEFLRWRAERWLKLRHLPTALLHSPGFAVRHGMQVLAHTFRGSSFRSLVGLEDERKVFARYRAIRKTERTYV